MRYSRRESKGTNQCDIPAGNPKEPISAIFPPLDLTGMAQHVSKSMCVVLEVHVSFLEVLIGKYPHPDRYYAACLDTAPLGICGVVEM